MTPPSFLLPFFERYLCVASVRITPLRTLVLITGPFAYSRSFSLSPSIPVTSPCNTTLLTRYDLPQPLRPLAPTDRLPRPHSQAVPLAA
jgi:hypothetical protein